MKNKRKRMTRELIMKKRILYLDVLRIIACLGVIANHTNIILSKAEIDISSVSQAELCGGVLYMALCKVAVTLFLMISGSLLLQKIDHYKKNFYRIFRISVVLLVFSFGYYIVGHDVCSIADFFKTISKTNITKAFWYLYLYLGILVMLPVLQRMVRNFRKKDYWYFFFFSFGICSFSFITEYNTLFSLPVFATPVGIFLLGYYLDNYINFEKYNFKIFIATGFSFSILIVGFLYAYTKRRLQNGAGVAAYRLMVYDNVFYVALSVLVFLMVKYTVCKCLAQQETNTKESNVSADTPTVIKVISFVASCTFGIYLLSDYIISLFMPAFEKWADQSNVYMLFIVIILDITVFLTCFLITALLLQIPIIKRFL